MNTSLASPIGQALADLMGRALAEGGFAERHEGAYRTDATAWAAILLDALGVEERYVLAAGRLAKDQLPDGRVPVSSGHPDAWWPTPLAVVAWAGVDRYRVEKDRATQFLLHVTGNNPPKANGDPVGHDTTLRGWPWIEGTHSWVEPTSLTLQALRAVGIEEQPRVQEGVRLLLNRQLPHGGWNYGNTTIFGKELHPMPESTGAALAGLAGLTDKSQVGRSVDYLQGELDKLRTPISLGWSLLGLAAWNRWPPQGERLIHTCLQAQARYGAYDTGSLCLLMLAAVQGGLIQAPDLEAVDMPARPTS